MSEILAVHQVFVEFKKERKSNNNEGTEKLDIYSPLKLKYLSLCVPFTPGSCRVFSNLRGKIH